MRRILPGTAAAALLATLLTVPAVPVAAAAAAPVPGTMTGTITDDDGRPLAGACVSVYQMGYLEYPLGRACAGDDGVYAVAGLPTTGNPLKVEATAPGYPAQWHPQMPNFHTAQAFPAGNTAPVDIRFTRRTGTVRGTITWPDGAPDHRAQMYLLPVTPGARNIRTFTRLDGSYDLTGVPAGDYRLSFMPDESVAGTQYVPGGTTLEQAAVVTVPVGGDVVVNDVVLPSFAGYRPEGLAVITGTVRDRETGAPVAGACVELHDVNYVARGVPRAVACTDASGVYTVPGVATGMSYKVTAQAAGYRRTWAPDELGFYGADYQAVSAGQVRTVDLGLRRTGGLLQGVLSRADGTPAIRDVLVSTLDEKWWTWTRTGFNGRYELDGLPPGQYQIRFGTYYEIQYWGQQQPGGARGVVTVTDGGTVTADHTMFPATLRVSLVHETTNMPVTDACVKVLAQQVCDSPSGTYQFTVRDGGLTVTVTGPAGYAPLTASVTTESGRQTDTTLTVRPTTTITLPVAVSKVTGTTPRVCARAVPVRFGQDRITAPTSYCNAPQSGYGTPVSSTLTIGLAAAEPVNVFVWSPDSKHGAQWVGPHGGTGQRRHAAVVTPVLAGAVTGPQVTMDAPVMVGVDGYRADRYERVPTCASPVGLTGGLEGLGYPRCTGAVSYLQFLGPYTWDVAVHAPGFATTWLPGGNDRATAAGAAYPGGQWDVQVRLQAGAKLSGTVQAAAGWTPHDVTVFSAVTGDIVAQQQTTGAYTFDTLNSGPLLVRVRAADGRSCWHQENTGPGLLRRYLASYLFVTAGKPRTGLTLALGPGCRTAPPTLVSPPSGVIATAVPGR